MTACREPLRTDSFTLYCRSLRQFGRELALDHIAALKDLALLRDRSEGHDARNSQFSARVSMWKVVVVFDLRSFMPAMVETRGVEGVRGEGLSNRPRC
jgi:hypothetical protein